MSPKHAIQEIKNNIEQTYHGEDISFRWKTPDKFMHNGKVYELSEEDQKELRNDIGKIIHIYLNSQEHYETG